MKRVQLSFFVRMAALAVLSISLASSAMGAADDEPETISLEGGQFATLDSPDTLRTNLWLSEALMGEIVRSTMQVLPAAPARILMVSGATSVQDDLFYGIAAKILTENGYELFVKESDVPMDLLYSFSVEEVELEYPETHRTLGLWKRWISRELNVAVQVKISLEETGQLLLSQRIVRRFADRVEADDFTAVESKLYDFTTAETSESGWHSRIEEIVVLGTLAGLIAIYFSNTGN